MADSTAQQMLAEQIDPAAFETRALEYAAARGVSLAADDLRAPPLCDAAWPGTAWLPVSLGEAGVDWVHFAGIKPDHPFFEDTVRAVAARPFNRLFRHRTPLHAFVAAAPAHLPMPRGLIFHMSRCGSTLVAQMLGTIPDTAVFAEPPPFDAALRHEGKMLRATAAALGRGYRDYLIKCDAWHIRDLPAIRAAFPGIPWIFLYRDPVEVLASHARMPGRHVAPGIVPALDRVAPGRHGMDHAACILAALCEAAIEGERAGGGMLVDYAELPDAVFTRILPHFGLAPSSAETALMAAAAGHDAKAPDRAFRPDGAAKREQASDDVRAAARRLAPLYSELEAIRAASRRGAV